MSDASFVKFASYGSVFDAEIDRATLEDAGIPAIVRSNHPGVHGAGFHGMYIGGVELLVPDVALDEVRALLGDPDEDAVGEAAEDEADAGDAAAYDA